MKPKMTYWKDVDGTYLGFLKKSFPDHWTRGQSLEDLKAYLVDLYQIFSQEELPGIRQETKLELL